MSLSFTGLEKLEGGQQGIEGFFGNKQATGSPIKVGSIKRPRSSSPSASRVVKEETPKPNLSVSEASPRKKPRLPTLQSGKPKTGLDTFLSLSKNGESSSSKSTRNSPIIMDMDDTEVDEIVEMAIGVKPRALQSESTLVGEDTTDHWSCSKCNFRTEKGLSQSELKGEKQEHEDFHFAQDLQNGVSPIRPKAVSGIGIGTAKKKKERKPEGIKAFFTKSVKKE